MQNRKKSLTWTKKNTSPNSEKEDSNKHLKKNLSFQMESVESQSSWFSILV